MTLHQRILQIMKAVLEAHDGNRTYAANELAISVRTIRNWINRFDELREFRRTR